MKFKEILLLSVMVVLLASPSVNCAPRADAIKSQSEFETVLQEARDGKPVNVTLVPGTYCFDKPVKTSAPFRMAGNGAVIKGILDNYSIKEAVRKENGYYVCKLNSPIPSFSLFLDADDNVIPVSESVDGDSLVNVCEEVKGEFSREAGTPVRIPLPASIAAADGLSLKSAYGYFDCGWTVGVFHVDGVENSEMLCRVQNSLNTRNFNYDRDIYKRTVRYVVFNAEPKPGCIHYTETELFIPENYESVQVMKTSEEPVLSSSADMEFSGLEFRNFGRIYAVHKATDVMRISSCTFLNSLSTSIDIKKKAASDLVPATIENCTFLHCGLFMGSTLRFGGVTSGINACMVKNCTFRRYDDAPLMYKNPNAMFMLWGDCEISGCTFSNSPRCHVYCARGTNVVRNNVIFNTEAFNSYKERNLSHDFGLIYVDHYAKKNETALSSKDHVAVIEDNLIYGALANGKDARGIMIDDGRGDVKCRRNVVHIPSTFYSIDSRECKKFIGTSSIRNVFEDNVVTVRYRLQGGVDVPKSDLPVSSRNIILGKMENVLKNAEIKKNDVVFENASVSGVEDGKLVLDNETAKALKKLIRSPHIK